MFALMAFLPLSHQRGGEPVCAGAAVKNQKLAVGRGQLDAGRIAAEVVGAGPGWRSTPRSPETYSHGASMQLGSKTTS
jgi:hypothetical protein